MKKTIAIILGVATTTVLLLLAASRFPRKPRPLEIRTNDLGYQEHSPEELSAEHLLDLNTANLDDLVSLGLNAETCEKIVENRPYRNKLDLLSRMVIPEQAYSAIKHQVGVAKATESVKFAG
jgi:DNA uptake protein ComE-like DNA-binding protein